ncbi:MAG TPA: biotin transporter BioY [Candidatus Limnocylindrales bacterium]|nr:biotin transporter BioY [Candidatus Limnocylindrales bacterium]
MTIGLPGIDRLPSIDRLPAQERGITIGDFLVPIRLSERMTVRARHIALILAGTILIALSAQVVIPVPGSPVPITGQTFGVLLSAGALGFRRGIAATVLYVLVGMVGLPVFAHGSHGVEIVTGATGGYLIGFIAAAAVIGRLAELGWDRNLLGAIGAMLIGSVLIYAFGLPWLAYVVHLDATTTLQEGLYPYIPGDVAKLALAAVAFPAAWWVVGRRPGDR